MTTTRMPAIFAGHGSPMLALQDTDVTRGLKKIGIDIVERFGKPKAILSVSAHWYTKGTYVHSTENPQQVYDMYGFPQELYDFTYPVKGSTALAEQACELLGTRAVATNDWGIDHGTWTVLCHMFPNADVPVVQLSVDATVTAADIYEIGKSLAPLRDEGYLLFASGNVVHNLRHVEWDNPGGSTECVTFNDTVTNLVRARDDDAVLAYTALTHASYAVPTPDHFLPLLYMLGASEKETPSVFNNHCELGALAMTGYAFGMYSD